MPNQSTQSWKELAAQASHEKDPEKLIALTRELINAFDQELAKRKSLEKPDVSK